MEPFNLKLKRLTEEKNSLLCVGLDISSEALGINNLDKLKKHTFTVIDATREYAVAYKPNLAFFERYGSKGFKWLEKTIEYIGTEHIIIADAKRGDIGNTAEQYAKSIFDHFGFDCVTLNPYMGSDSIKPVINKPGKGVFVLCRTSNKSASELQDHPNSSNPVYEVVAKTIKELNILDNIGLVVGATRPEIITYLRELVPFVPFLIPGIGFQGGDLSSCVEAGNKNGIGIINISRGISFVGDRSEKAIHCAASDYLDRIRKILVK